MVEWEDYLIDNSDVLKNKLNISDKSELKKKGIEISVFKLTQLYFLGVTGNFDQEHLCQIHRFIFSDIYYFAGEYREVNIFKSTGFLDFNEISEGLYLLMNKMNNMKINENSKFEIAKYIADYYYELINIHPFREGNGRTIREFIR